LRFRDGLPGILGVSIEAAEFSDDSGGVSDGGLWDLFVCDVQARVIRFAHCASECRGDFDSAGSTLAFVCTTLQQHFGSSS